MHTDTIDEARPRGTNGHTAEAHHGAERGEKTGSLPEQTNEDLIAELRGFTDGSESARATLMRDPADRLESVAKDSAESQYQHAFLRPH